jgi:hypothetical protein
MKVSPEIVRISDNENLLFPSDSSINGSAELQVGLYRPLMFRFNGQLFSLEVDWSDTPPSAVLPEIRKRHPLAAQFSFEGRPMAQSTHLRLLESSASNPIVLAALQNLRFEVNGVLLLALSPQGDHLVLVRCGLLANVLAGSPPLFHLTSVFPTFSWTGSCVLCSKKARFAEFGFQIVRFAFSKLGRLSSH